jgi:hypothetical protein
MASARFLPRAGYSRRFLAQAKKPRARLPPLRSGRSAARFAVRARPRAACLIAEKAARVAAGQLRKDTIMAHSNDTTFASPRQSSPTAAVIAELQLYVYRPLQDEPDPRPLPDERAVQTALADIFDALVATLGDTRLEPDLENLLWSAVNLFHRAADRAQRELDDNEDRQHRSQREQDGSEVRSVELERPIAEGITNLERCNAFEFMRDHAAELFEPHTGSAWTPRAGSKVNHNALTAAIIDSRNLLPAKQRAETQVMLPEGTRIAFAGGLECNDHRTIWDTLDRARTKHPDMVLLHGGSPKGAERIAACWAEKRNVPQIVVTQDWTRHAKAAPFKCNDQLLATMPRGVIIFPGSGITEGLADKARRLGIPVWRFGGA